MLVGDLDERDFEVEVLACQLVIHVKRGDTIFDGAHEHGERAAALAHHIHGLADGQLVTIRYL